ncbi:MAG: hypothetical protein J7578_13215 [Chitinophagaceae bacterium]|nr:hypothetical protein [Chitinophagaceae bacterium]
MRKHYHFVCALLLSSFSSFSQLCTLTQADLLAAPGSSYTIPAGATLCITSDLCMGSASNFPGACSNTNISSLTINGRLIIEANVTFKFQGSVNGTGALDILGGGRFSLFGSINCTSMQINVVDQGITTGTSSNGLNSCSSTACEVVYTGGYRPFGVVFDGLGYTTTACNLTGYPNDAKVLPVNFSSFNGFASGMGIRLNWSTASEQNNKGFEVQRINASNEWVAAGWVPSKATDGNSSLQLDYSFMDDQPGGLNSKQYRLKQVDLNDHFTYSSVIRVEGLRSNEWRVSAAGGNIKVQVQAASQENAVITVVSAAGNTLYKGTHPLSPGSNMILIPSGTFAKGLQVVTLQTGGGEMRREKILLR